MSEITHIELDGASMPVLMDLPDRESAPAVIVCMHAPGVDTFIEEIARRLAVAGIAAYAPDFYYRQDDGELDPLARMAKLRDAELEADLAAVHTFIGTRGHQRIGVLGFCMGGRIGLLAAAHLPALRAAVSFYGGFLREAWGPGRPPIEQVASIDCPLLAFHGTLDTNPSPKDMEDLSLALTEAGKEHVVETCEGVGHAFLNFNRPGYQEEIAMRAWRQCEHFLEQHLRF